MTTQTIYGGELDLSTTTRPPMSRLVKVELRKMVDTRAGMWLMLIMALVTVVAVTIFGFAGNDADQTYYNFLQFAGSPQGFLLPVMGILLVTQEWGQRTAMVTFTLEPNRGRVIAAKVSAALLVALAAYAIALAVGALATVVFGPSGAFDEFGGIDFLKIGLVQLIGIMQGLAFGLVFMNSAAAIVLYFVLPSVFGVLSEFWAWLRDAAPWIDLGTAQGPIFERTGNLTGEEWVQLGVTTVIWLVVPFVVGLWRMLRAEVK